MELPPKKPEISDNLAFMLANDMATEILYTLAFFKSLNLKKLSEIIGNKPAPILYNIRRLLDRKLVELDSVATEHKKGKYYKLTQVGYDLLDKEKEEFIEKYDKYTRYYTFNTDIETPIAREIFELARLYETMSVNEHKITRKLRYDFLLYHADDIVKNEKRWELNNRTITGRSSAMRFNIEDPEREEVVREFINRVHDELNELQARFLREDQEVFTKTGKNPNSLAEGKNFFLVTLSAAPLYVETPE